MEDISGKCRAVSVVIKRKINLRKGERIKVNVTIAPAVKELGEVLVTTSGVGKEDFEVVEE